jgi:hypothetical protein
LHDVGAAIRAAQRLDEVLVLIADYARRALDASTVSIGRRDYETSSLQVLVNCRRTGSRPRADFPPTRPTRC